MNLEQLLSECIDKKASDLHLSTGLAPAMRIDGDLCFIDAPSCQQDKISEMLHDIMDKNQQQAFASELEFDFGIDIEALNARFRVNAFMQERGPAVVFRVIPQQILSLETLNAPDIFKKIVAAKQGLILVTGPTGSGKSTTLATMIDHINHTQKGHIISIEDPIEFVHPSKKCLINQREVKRDTLSFNNALKSALREDPDYIFVGEMRDLESIRLAITAAETGHLVLATLHTASAPKTIDRIINVFPAEEQHMVRSMLSESLQAVISQVLLKKKGGGRVAAHEILLANTAICHLIHEGKIAQMYNTLQTSQDIGMQILQQSIDKLIAKGMINAP